MTGDAVETQAYLKQSGNGEFHCSCLSQEKKDAKRNEANENEDVYACRHGRGPWLPPPAANHVTRNR
jgi:predicted SprT family Zn-dependent metalloprotease